MDDVTRFHITGHMARDFGNSGRHAEISSHNFQRIRQGATRCLTLLLHTVVADGAPGAKCDIYDCLVYSFNRLPRTFHGIH